MAGEKFLGLSLTVLPTTNKSFNDKLERLKLLNSTRNIILHNINCSGITNGQLDPNKEVNFIKL